MTKTSDTVAEISKALAAAQAEIQNPEKNKNAKVKGKSKAGRDYEYGYKYADIADVLTTVLPPLSKHKIAVIQPTEIVNGALFINTRICHESGEWIESQYPVCSINGDHQQMGGAMTYARRYALCSMVGVAADEDIDGQGAATVDNKKQPASKPSAPKYTGPSKADSRPIYDKLYKGIAQVMREGSYDDLTKWGKTIAKEIDTIHPDWHSQLQTEFSNALVQMKQAAKDADQMVQNARESGFPDAELERESA